MIVVLARRFGLCIDVEQDARIMVDVESPRAQVLAAADVIIMDEISSTHSKIVDYVDRLLRAVPPRLGNLPFGGKVIFLLVFILWNVIYLF